MSMHKLIKTYYDWYYQNRELQDLFYRAVGYDKDSNIIVKIVQGCEDCIDFGIFGDTQDYLDGLRYGDTLNEQGECLFELTEQLHHEEAPPMSYEELLDWYEDNVINAHVKVKAAYGDVRYGYVWAFYDSIRDIVLRLISIRGEMELGQYKHEWNIEGEE